MILLIIIGLKLLSCLSWTVIDCLNPNDKILAATLYIAIK